ncbi:hypothetical protein H0H81_006084 [Sphagnurus paluster]|uniref:Uncharacterized protein n=1 Tax=Sphagnurus paluster TaxID=117069 RepID=A0A9P7K7R8_9AGAR|nr:hypothetical protein H0H81_006084 [Sphagnurus paluster]
MKLKLEQISEQLFKLGHEHFEHWPAKPEPEIMWTAHAELVNKIIGFSKKLKDISETAPPVLSLLSDEVDKRDVVSVLARLSNLNAR